MPIHLKLMPDYECFALWNSDKLENIDADRLPISEKLKARIHRWEKAFDQTLCLSDPMQSGFPTIEQRDSFDAEGQLIWNELKKELGSGYIIRYFSVVIHRLL